MNTAFEKTSHGVFFFALSVQNQELKFGGFLTRRGVQKMRINLKLSKKNGIINKIRQTFIVNARTGHKESK